MVPVEGNSGLQSTDSCFVAPVAWQLNALHARFGRRRTDVFDQFVGFGEKMLAAGTTRRVPGDEENIVPFLRPGRRGGTQPSAQTANENVEHQAQTEPFESLVAAERD